MGMQDVDFDLIYEPGKSELERLDFLSRHPLLETCKDAVERALKFVVAADHAVLKDRRKKKS